MTEGLTGIINQLERQKTTIERALAALREIDAPASASTSNGPITQTVTRAVRNRWSEGQKKRWAAKKAAEAAAAAPPAKAVRRKVRITPEGRERLAEAMRRRWAIKRTAAQARKSSRQRKAA